MKAAPLCLSALLWLVSNANAGINGTYRVTGSEAEGSKRIPFTGTVTVSGNRIARFYIGLQDSGPPVRFGVTFNTALSQTSNLQTVSFSTGNISGNATFRLINGTYRISFSYLDKPYNARGRGSGSKG